MACLTFEKGTGELGAREREKREKNVQRGWQHPVPQYPWQRDGIQARRGRIPIDIRVSSALSISGSAKQGKQLTRPMLAPGTIPGPPTSAAPMLEMMEP